MFLPIRAKSVQDQLAGKSKGLTLSEFGGFGPPLGTMFGPNFLKALDANGDGTVTRAEVTQRFAAWFAQWSGGSAVLTEKQLNAGLDKTIKLPAFGPPGDGFGPPPRP